ncbi:hypothetical protein F5Y16DRAFT_401902 [Xylariaceae sp. FL0255]|nr:hypothetical protein F5Y16DRAFT_401902 [Xylariaceae sp. FL0255]
MSDSTLLTLVNEIMPTKEVTALTCGMFAMIFWIIRLTGQLCDNHKRKSVGELKKWRDPLVPLRWLYLLCGFCWAVCCCLALAVISITGPNIYYTRETRILAFIQPEISIAVFIVTTWQVSKYEFRAHQFFNLTLALVMAAGFLTWQIVCITATTGVGKDDTILLCILASFGVVFGYFPLWTECALHQGRMVSISLVCQISGTAATVCSFVMTCESLVVSRHGPAFRDQASWTAAAWVFPD